MSAPQTTERKVCDGFAWVGQSLLCCDDCGQPWFLHAGEKRYVGGPFSREQEIRPWPKKNQARIPREIAAWEANNIWQNEGRKWIADGGRDQYGMPTGTYGPEMERQVGKDFPYATGPTRPVAPSQPEPSAEKQTNADVLTTSAQTAAPASSETPHAKGPL